MKRDMIFQRFALKWGLAEPTVHTIFLLVQDTGGKYGKTSRALQDMGISLSVRQIKYFYRKTKLEMRYGTREQIGNDNYEKLVKSKV